MKLTVSEEDGVVQQSDTIQVAGIRYFIEAVQQDESNPLQHNPGLLTVIDLPPGESVITCEFIERRIDAYESSDDVFQNAFLQGVVFMESSKGSSLSHGAEAYLQGRGMQWYYFESVKRLKSFPPGVRDKGIVSFKTPNSTDIYFKFDNTREITDAELQVLIIALTEDFIDHFASSKIHSKHSSLPQEFQAILKTLGIIVAKLRLLFPRDSVANFGACIVGKTKLCSFASWEEPTEAIEYTSPWSPRADGFQSSGGSSNGSGAAVAAYDWLDVAIGSDTTGSILRPALWNGCFSLRPTFGLLSTIGFVNCIKYLDTPGIMTRDLGLCSDFANAWYGKELEKFFPKADEFTSIIWPTDYWHQINGEQQKTAFKFVEEMEAALDLQRQEVSFKEQWQWKPPQDAGNLSLYDYMIRATQDMWYDDYHQFDGFREEHWTDRDEAKRKIDIFRSWFRGSFFEAENPLIVVPIENVRPRYRDEPPK
ncbi:MAG: hypothetical protein Q9190_001005 [Brigantiaea leucoxantha]